MIWLSTLALAADITPQDAATVASIRGLTVSPSGRVVAYLEQRWDAERDGRVTDIWRTAVVGGTPERLTFSASAEWSLSFSPDSEHLYFLQADEDGETQVFRMSVEGGPAVPITAAPKGVREYSLAGRSLWYTTGAEQPRGDEFSGLRSAHSTVEYGHDPARTTALHRLDLDTFRDATVLSGQRAIYDLEVSPDGAMVAMLSAPDQPLIWREGYSEVEILVSETGERYTLPAMMWREQAPSPYGWLGGLSWNDGGDKLAFDVGFDGYSPMLFVAEFDDGAHVQTTPYAVAEPYTHVGDNAWWGNTLCYTASDRARLRLVCQQDDGRSMTLTPQDDAVVWGWQPAGRDVVVLMARSDALADLYTLRDRRLRPLTHANPQADGWTMPQSRIVSWTAPDGTTVEGMLWLPADHDGDSPLPTIVHLHGGPTWSTHVGFPGVDLAVYPAKGWAVFSPNYRGSIGYGDAFLVELVGRENDVEVADILAGVDHLVEAGIADPDKLAVMGWSNGGYLTNCLISKTDRFKAASSGAGVFDQTLQWAMEDTPGHVVNYMKGLPWEQPEAVQAASPLFAADQITTPTLIHVGERDPRVPAAHSRALFRALSFYLDVPVELMVYPGAGHGLSKLSHRSAKLAWDIAWLEKYVLGIEPGAEMPDDGEE